MRVENVPVRFARDNPQRLDAKARWRPGRSEAWLRFGNRASALTGKPWRATSPGNAMLNFLFAVARTEMAVALHAAGLDEGIGLFHADVDGRPSLALDAIEAVRPLIEMWLLEFLAAAAFTNRDFHETDDGEVRLTHPLNSHLAHTAALWRPACQSVAQWLASAFGDTIGTARPRRPKAPDHHPEPSGALVEAAVPMLAGPWAARLPPGFTPLSITTASGRRHAFSAMRDHLLRGALHDAPVPLTCWQCGRALPQGRRRFCSDEHAVAYHRDSQWGGIVAATIARYADPKRAAASKTAIGTRAVENATQRLLWRQRPGWSKVGDEALRQWFAGKAQAGLGDCKLAAIMAATGLSKQLAADIRSGRHIPHPRHFEALAKLAGVEAPAL
jgi:CRISPR associated protein Cas1